MNFATPFRRVALVGCSGPKLDRPAPARELYTSPLFKLASAWAETKCDAWAVLSANGLIFPDWEVDPYDRRVKRGDAFDWAHAIAESVRTHFTGAAIVLLAGTSYTDPLREVWRSRAIQRKHAPNNVTEPLRGLQIGERLAWFKRELGREVGPLTCHVCEETVDGWALVCPHGLAFCHEACGDLSDPCSLPDHGAGAAAEDEDLDDLVAELAEEADAS